MKKGDRIKKQLKVIEGELWKIAREAGLQKEQSILEDIIYWIRKCYCLQEALKDVMKGRKSNMLLS